MYFYSKVQTSFPICSSKEGSASTWVSFSRNLFLYFYFSSSFYFLFCSLFANSFSTRSYSFCYLVFLKVSISSCSYARNTSFNSSFYYFSISFDFLLCYIRNLLSSSSLTFINSSSSNKLSSANSFIIFFFSCIILAISASAFSFCCYLKISLST